jgi:hypothetical protein
MEVTVPAVLSRLAQSGVSVHWRDGKAVFKAAAAPPADIVALINARKAEVSAFLNPEAVQRRLHAETDVLQRSVLPASATTVGRLRSPACGPLSPQAMATKLSASAGGATNFIGFLNCGRRSTFAAPGC